MWFNGKLLKLMHKHQKVKMNKITKMGMTATTTIMSNCHIASIKTRYEAPNFWHLLDEIRYFQFFASKFLNYYNKIRVREHAWWLIIFDDILHYLRWISNFRRLYQRLFYKVYNGKCLFQVYITFRNNFNDFKGN